LGNRQSGADPVIADLFFKCFCNLNFCDQTHLPFLSTRTPQVVTVHLNSHLKPETHFESRAGGIISFLASFVVHTALLVILACWVYSAGKESQGLLISAERGESSETSFEIVPMLEVEPELVELPQQVQPDVKLFELDLAVQAEPQTHSDNAQVSAALASMSASQATDSLANPLKKKGAAFFGAYAEGRRFVYILDSSRSMLQDDRWTYACNQLIDSLNGLEEGQEFFVMCFDVKTSFLFNTSPAKIEFFRADGETVARVKRWLRSRVLGRATMPAEALQYALQLHPDAIFLLSDGELQDNSLGILRAMNGFSSSYSQVPIHTVHLFSEQGRETLQVIARENGGSFHPVSLR
jgi:hypothetical protein